MKKLSNHEVLKALAAALNKPCMYISFSYGDEDDDVTSYREIFQAAPYLNFDDDMQFVIEGGGIIVFDTVEEMERTYDLTVGDDGPTRLNPYAGKARVYALTCSATGQMLTENT